MKVIKTTTNVYEYDELSDSAKENAISNYYDINVFDEWWDSVYEDAKTIGLKITSFDLNPIGCEGEWITDAEDAAALVMEHHGCGCTPHVTGCEPEEGACETYKTAWEFQNAISVQGSIFEAQDDFDADYEEFTESDQYKELCSEFLTDLCSDYGTMLDKQHTYLQSDEAIKDTILVNGYEFLEDGEKYEG